MNERGGPWRHGGAPPSRTPVECVAGGPYVVGPPPPRSRPVRSPPPVTPYATVEPPRSTLAPGRLCRVQLPASLAAHPDDRGPVVRARLIATHQRVVTVAEHVIGAGVLRQTYRLAVVLIEGEAEPREVALERVVLAGSAGPRRARTSARTRSPRVPRSRSDVPAEPPDDSEPQRGAEAPRDPLPRVRPMRNSQGSGAFRRFFRQFVSALTFFPTR